MTKNKIIVIAAFSALLILFLSWITGSLIEKLLPASAESGKNIVELVSSIGWLTFAVVGLIALFEPLSSFLEGISSRITKLTVFDVGIEVAQLAEYTPTWSKVDGGDIRKITPPFIFDSGSRTLFQEITEATSGDYAVIDLGDGKQWLTSRLYFFAIMLERARGIKAFVFVAPAEAQAKCYVGTARTNDIRWRLARKYPWLEESFADGYSKVIAQEFHLQKFVEKGRMDEYTAREIAQKFLRKIQRSTKPAKDLEKWVELKSAKLYENAEWLELSLLRSILGDSLYTGKVIYSPVESPPQQAKNIAAVDEPLVALTKSEGAFHSLVDRQALLEIIALRALSSLSDAEPKPK